MLQRGEKQSEMGEAFTLDSIVNSIDAELIATGPSDKGPNRGAIIRHGRYVLWGYEGPVSDMTEAGRKLFINVLHLTARYADAPVLEKRNNGTRDNLFESLAYARRSPGYLNTIKSLYVPKSLSEDHLEEIEGWVVENRPYLRVEGRVFVVDAFARRLGTPNHKKVFIERCIAALEKGEEVEESVKALERYTGRTGFGSSSPLWKKWYTDHKDYLYFSDCDGFRFLIDEEAKQKGESTASLRGWSSEVLNYIPLQAAQKKSRTNFLFILVDDLGWTDLGCNGSTFYETPNVDRLCSEGMKFTDAYAACPVCSPTRASILTGRYPARLKITDYINPGGGNQPEKWKRNTRLLPARYADRLPHDEVTLPETLKEAGYATFFAGKWHLGPEDFLPTDHGFDVNKGGREMGGPYGGKKYFSPYGNPYLEDGPDGEHLPDRLASETVKFIKANHDKPFLAYLSFYSVHTPLMTRADLKEKYLEKRKGAPKEAWGKEGSRKVRLVQNHAVYAGMVEAMDQAVGKVLGTLRDLGLDKNTVVIFMSDNGGLSTSEGHPTSNLPLRAGKGWLYEGGIREPMFIKWPGITKPGSLCSEPVTSTDFYPTMLEVAGLAQRPEQHLDGVSLAPLLRGEKTVSRDALYWHYPHYGNQGGSPGAAVRAGRWKLIEFYEDHRVELYNLKEDLEEKNDLAAANPEKAEGLRKMLHTWLREVGAEAPKTNPAFKEIGSIPSVYPCKEYLDGLRGKGNFGVLVDKAEAGSVFKGTYHLAVFY